MSEGVPPSVAPPSTGGGGVGAVHTPCTDPAATTQVLPATQQSPATVQAPPVGEQEEAPHLSAPLASGTQAALLQQSAESAQNPPAITQLVRP